MGGNKVLSDVYYIHEPIADGVERRWEITDTLFAGATKYQYVEVLRTFHGVTLFCNSERQSSEFSQKAYHEGQVVPALISMPHLPHSALVIGSSEGVVCQILKEAGVEEVVHVDLDEECLSICSRLLPYGYSVADVEKHIRGEGGVTLLFGDGVTFLRRAVEVGRNFDLIVMDVPDFCAGNAELYSEELYRLVNEVLNSGGAFITQAGNPALWRSSGLKAVQESMRAAFEAVNYFEIREHDWVWLIGYKGSLLSEGEIIERLGQLRYVPEYIDKLTVKAAMIPPISIRKR